MILLNKENIDKVFTMKEAIEADKLAFKLFSQGRTDVPLRVKISNEKQNGVNLFMPGYIKDLDAAGIKIVSVFPENAKKNVPVVPATMILLDGETGQVSCILDGTYLTQLRTGAASGAAIDILARKDSKTGALFGTGGQAEKQLEAMLCARKLEKVKVFDIDKVKTAEFAEIMNDKFKSYGAQISAAESSDEAVKDADIITVVTTAKNPVFNGRLVKKGAHINGVGSYTPDMQEIDEFIIENADKIFVESKDAVLAEAGDFIIPIEKGIITSERITGELGSVIAGDMMGRENDEQITIFKTVGIAVQDIVTANQIYKKAVESKIGLEIDI